MPHKRKKNRKTQFEDTLKKWQKNCSILLEKKLQNS